LKIDPDDAAAALTAVALKRQMVDGLLLLLSRGCALPVLAVLCEYFDSPNAVPQPPHARACAARTIDHLRCVPRAQDMSLVRHSVLQLFALVAPPFSHAFASQLLRISRHGRVREAFRDAKSKAALAAGVEELAAGADGDAAAGSPSAQLVAELVALAARPSA